MNMIGVFYGTTLGHAEAVAALLAKELGPGKVELHDIARGGLTGIGKYKQMIFGLSTGSDGNLAADWAAHWNELDGVDLAGVRVALFGVSHPSGDRSNCLEALAQLHRKLLARGAAIVGRWPAVGDNSGLPDTRFDDSKTLAGLVLDQKPQGDHASRLVARWAVQVRGEFEAGGGVNLARYLLDAHPDDDKTAYFYDETTISRSELKRMVAAIASHLQTVLAPGDRAIVALNDSPLQIAAFLACMAIGAIPAVTNPRLPAEQIKAMADGCGARLLAIENERLGEFAALTQGSRPLHLVASLPSPAAPSLDAWVKTGDPGWQDYAALDGDQPCYLQFTSGSTGEAKAVIHTFDNTVATCRLFAAEHLRIGQDDVVYAVPKLFFGYGMGNTLFFPLYTGAAAVIDGNWPTPEGVRRNLERFRPSVFFAVPAMYRSLRGETGLITDCVRLAFSAGSPLPASEFQYWQEHGIEICDGIGATEVCHVFLSNRPGQARAGCTGKPLPEIQCQLIDQHGQIVTGTDEVGVLMVKGPILAKGYWGKEAATAERFIDGWYRTGDLFSVDAEGFYSHHGREDDLFKVNGRWVTPLPVEKAVCEAFPLVAEAVLVPSTGEHDALPPTLFVTPADATAASVGSAIEGWLAGRFPSHVRPRKVISIDGMPRNHNGKLMRSALIARAQQSLRLEA